MSKSKKETPQAPQDPQTAEHAAAENSTGGIKKEPIVNIDDFIDNSDLLEQALGINHREQKNKGESIYSFEPGDIIINVLPRTRVSYDSPGYFGLALGSIRREEPDLRFRRPLKFISIQNSIIYLRLMDKNGPGQLVSVSVDTMEKGWELFKLPEGVSMEEACYIPQS